MKVRSIIFLASLSFIFFSCASNDVAKNTIEESDTIQDIEITEEDEVVTLDEPEEIIEIIEVSPEEEFINSLENVVLSAGNAPKQIIKRGKFNTPFTVKVTDASGAPLSGYSVTVEYPASKKDTVVNFASEILTTDENGTCSVSLTNTDFAINDYVTFYPTPLFETQEVIDASKEKKAQIEVKIKSDILNKGAVLFVWDFNERNRPLNNSYEILSEFRNRGMALVGNAPINETSYIDKPLSTIYKANYEIIEDSYGYLICGTIKFTKPVEPCDDGYLCSLVAEISAVNMKNGEVVFSSSFANEATGANWNKATGKCKDELSEQIVNALVYGL